MRGLRDYVTTMGGGVPGMSGLAGLGCACEDAATIPGYASLPTPAPYQTGVVPGQLGLSGLRGLGRLLGLGAQGPSRPYRGSLRGMGDTIQALGDRGDGNWGVVLSGGQTVVVPAAQGSTLVLGQDFSATAAPVQYVQGPAPQVQYVQAPVPQVQYLQTQVAPAAQVAPIASAQPGLLQSLTGVPGSGGGILQNVVSAATRGRVPAYQAPVPQPSQQISGSGALVGLVLLGLTGLAIGAESRKSKAGASASAAKPAAAAA